ncbi:MAG TPA: hypothetical protein VGN00_29285 [Puia sp.]
MNAQSLNVLRDAMKKIGHPNFLELTIEPVELSGEQPLEVQLTDVFYRDDSSMEVTLYFERPEKGVVYSFTRYKCHVRYYKDPTKNRAYTFYRSKFVPTIREAYNLLLGRSINKDVTSAPDEVYNAWLTLNFREKDTNGNYKLHYFPTKNGYQIERILDLYPIQELFDDELKANLLLSLKAGDSCLVTLNQAGKSQKVYIEASPKFKTIGIYPTKVSR